MDHLINHPGLYISECSRDISNLIKLAAGCSLCDNGDGINIDKLTIEEYEQLMQKSQKFLEQKHDSHPGHLARFIPTEMRNKLPFLNKVQSISERMHRKYSKLLVIKIAVDRQSSYEVKLGKGYCYGNDDISFNLEYPNFKSLPVDLFEFSNRRASDPTHQSEKDSADQSAKDPTHQSKNERWLAEIDKSLIKK